MSSGMWSCVDHAVNARCTQVHIPEYDILHSQPCENLRSYNYLHVIKPFPVYILNFRIYKTVILGTG
jgi:hypothetical protein